jgi:cysteine-rich repeat protein
VLQRRRQEEQPQPGRWRHRRNRRQGRHRRHHRRQRRDRRGRRSRGPGGPRGLAGSGGLAGSSGAAGAATGGTGGSPAVCGDKIFQPGEECDGTDFNGRTCATYGFGSGQLVCKSDCKIDTTGCTGTENCNDNADNDGDGKIDCLDSDCTGKCATACSGPPTLPDPSTVQGTTTSHGDSIKASCSSGTGGADLAYEFTATNAGVMEAQLGTLQDMTISARGTCSGSAAELGCSAFKRIKVPVTAGQKLWVFVDGASSGAAGLFTLTANSHPIVCGDGNRDGSEACDDKNTAAGDGCSPTCTIESSETEPNDNSGQANSLSGAEFYGTLSGASDVDFVAVNVANGNSTLNAAIYDFGDAGCTYGEMDSVIEIRGTNGQTVLASDDNSGDGLCSFASVSGLAAGKYYVAVKPAAGANPASFGYKLAIGVF